LQRGYDELQAKYDKLQVGYKELQGKHKQLEVKYKTFKGKFYAVRKLLAKAFKMSMENEVKPEDGKCK
jgi:hypothetical protein